MLGVDIKGTIAERKKKEKEERQKNEEKNKVQILNQVIQFF